MGATQQMTSSSSDWLPDLITLADHGGQWQPYCDALYAIFHRDFVASKPAYPSKRFALKRHPVHDGKEATFWHLISEGADESERLPDMDRCARIGWPRPMIESMADGDVCVWKNSRGGNQRILIALNDFSYVVVLDEREDYVLLWTAYCVAYPNRRRKMQKEFEEWQTNNKP
jgi:hypothetical protein